MALYEITDQKVLDHQMAFRADPTFGGRHQGGTFDNGITEQWGPAAAALGQAPTANISNDPKLNI